MEKEKKSLTVIELPNSLSEKLANRADNVSMGITDFLYIVLNNSQILLEIAKNELKGVFTPSEWRFLADRLMEISQFGLLSADENGGYSLQLALINDIYDAKSDHFKKRRSKEVRLYKKCLGLTSAQIYALYARIEELVTTEIGIEEWSHF